MIQLQIGGLLVSPSTGVALGLGFGLGFVLWLIEFRVLGLQRLMQDLLGYRASALACIVVHNSGGTAYSVYSLPISFTEV